MPQPARLSVSGVRLHEVEQPLRDIDRRDPGDTGHDERDGYECAAVQLQQVVGRVGQDAHATTPIDAAAHAYLNTTTFPGTGLQAEACATCHGGGKDHDVARAHAR